MNEIKDWKINVEPEMERKIKEYIDEYATVKRFINFCPHTVIGPEISLNAEQRITFEWQADLDNIFNLVIGCDQLIYTCLYKGKKSDGIFPYPSSEEIPKAFLAMLMKIDALVP